MSQNDVLQLDANFERWKVIRGIGLPEDIKPFYYYSVEHVLKAANLADAELLGGIVDGQNDGGIDAIYFFLDGENITEDSSPKPVNTPRVRLAIFQIKDGNSGPSPIEIEKIARFVPDLLNLSGPQTNELAVKYNESLVQFIRVFRSTFVKIAGLIPEIQLDCYYVTRGDAIAVDARSAEAIEHLKSAVLRDMGNARFEFHYIGVQELLRHIQARAPHNRNMTFAESPMSQAKHYVGVVRLLDYYRFLLDDNGAEQKSLYDSNVRGYQKDTTVNNQIRSSLQNPSTDFWLLNNGITILGADAVATGGSKNITVVDPQIVNGLQTSRAIFNHFSSPGDHEADSRCVLVRIIVNQDANVYDEIVRATNSQNKMAASSLRATDAIHRQIEDLFLIYDIFYDRRKGHYKDIGKPVSKIISMGEVLQAIISTVLRKPDDARARPGNYLTDDANTNLYLVQINCT